MRQEKTRPHVELDMGVIVVHRSWLMSLVVLLGLVAGCTRSIPVVADNRLIGMAHRDSSGYFVPCDVDSAMAAVTYTVNGSVVQLSFPDGFQKQYPLDGKSFKAVGGKLYIHTRLIGELFGLAAEVSSGHLQLRPIVPDIEGVVSDYALYLKGTSALHIRGRWEHNGYTLELPAGACNLVSQEYTLGREGVFTSVVVDLGATLKITLVGNADEHHAPEIRYKDARNIVEISWPRILSGLSSDNSTGRPSVHVPLAPHQKIELIGPPEVTPPRVTLRQRAHLYGGPGAFFTPLTENLPTGTEGKMIGYLPGFIKVQLRNSEGWFPEGSVSLDLCTPSYPLNIRERPAPDARVTGVVDPSSRLFLREKVQGGYAVWAPDTGMTGFILDGQNFFDNFNQHQRAGLSTALRFVVSQALPPSDLPALVAPFAMLDAVSYRGGTLFTVGVRAPMNLTTDRHEHGVTVHAGVNVQGVEITRVDSGDMLSVVADGAFAMEVRRVSRGLEVTICDATLSSSPQMPQAGELIERVQLTTVGSDVRMLVDFPAALAYRLIEGERLVVMKQGVKGKTIVIDPGHGGRDPGALGRLGWHEKDYTLDIALRLAAVLEEMGAISVMTHKGVSDDTLMYSDQRIAVINHRASDAFISIHLNAFTQPQWRGAETYYFEGEENVRLARLVQESMVESGMRNRQIVNSRTLAILRRGQPPGVLAEVGFITNPEDEHMLFDPARRQRLAENLAEAIRRFFRGEGK